MNASKFQPSLKLSTLERERLTCRWKRWFNKWFKSHSSYQWLSNEGGGGCYNISNGNICKMSLSYLKKMIYYWRMSQGILLNKTTKWIDFSIVVFTATLTKVLTKTTHYTGFISKLPVLSLSEFFLKNYFSNKTLSMQNIPKAQWKPRQTTSSIYMCASDSYI